MTSTADPHANSALLHTGQPLEEAGLVIVLLHGRGASAEDILSLAGELQYPAAYLAPQAANSTWYPYSFLAPLQSNQPWLDSALARIASILDDLSSQGITTERVVLGGFSQGACLASEFVARNPRRYAGLLAFSGGVIGPPGMPRQTQGDLAGTPVFLGCSDIDPHIPAERVEETAALLRSMGAQVEQRFYPRMGHTINQDEIDAARLLLESKLFPV